MLSALLTSLLISSAASAQAFPPGIDPRVEVVGTATYNFGGREFAPYFKKTMIMGHSISTGLMHEVGVLNFLQHFGEGPGTILARNYAKSKPIGNIAEGIGTMETGLTKMWRILEQQDDFDAAEGDNRRLSVMNKFYNEASAIVGVDAFYMTVVFNECADYGVDLTKEFADTDKSNEMFSTIMRFINKAYYDGKILVLGNVPKEDWWSVGPIELAVLHNNNEMCRVKVNRALKELCTPARNCYINDVEGIVKTYNELGYLTLNDGSRIYKRNGLGFNEVRPGGINLSERGVQVLVEDILAKMSAQPPVMLQAPPSIQPN